ncbi:MAG TPA: bifunctional YncE family protein/alkaline phosphatase family protein [Vicinamibacterales bacterium]|nr:bifunctional YncE family protein/alkaline phosphatase family protein [Vicinamibacterales bacterium]HPW21188.1 bifunctional YncE family protein/alkaline phosphatase family protein [Vicinamibacterales bacterium]
MRSRSFAAIFVVCALVVGAAVASVAQRGPAPPVWPGSLGKGVTLLPNGWKIQPAGRHIGVGDLPLAMAESPDGRFLVITNNGYAKPTLTVVDLRTGEVSSRVTLDHAWLGLAWHPDGRRLFSSGAGQTTVNEFYWASNRLTPGAVYALGRDTQRPMPGINRPEPVEQSFVGGVSLSPDGRYLYAVHVLGEALTMLDLKTGLVRQTVDLGAEPYTCLVSPDGSLVYVSVWGGARVAAFDAATLDKRAEIAVGEHPNAMVWSKDAARLFVACANTNSVWVIDAAAKAATEQISIALFPNAPPGATPNALGLSPDGARLLVANADNNAVAVVDVSNAARSIVEGFIPTGWYPTAAQFSKDGSQIYVLSGKGLTSLPNPRGPQPGVPSSDGQYSGSMLQGSLSVLPVPDAAALAALTRTVYALTPMTSAGILAPAAPPLVSPIPKKVGDSSPIKHVFYVIRENRTYDQILGDLERGNGDPSLCLFGEEVTPNAHAIAREFVLLDNFYVDAEVSYDGHAYSTGAYATDFVEKIWPTNYGGRGARYMSEGGGAMRNAYGNVAAPMNGYIWDACVRAGLSVRSYGEFTELEPAPAGGGPGGARKAVARVPGLVGRIHPTYPPWDLSVPDNVRVDVWLEEFRRFEKDGGLPALSILRIGGDHTAGTRAGYPTPRAMIAENDAALGRIVEAVSRSVYWKESAIFVLEDDAQNGPDHVDAHRSPAFVISPFVKRGVVDSTMYSTSGMLRTMELILGLPPMSNYDAAATPMYNAFQATPVLTPYRARPARIDVTEKNAVNAWGAAASAAMNMAEADLCPDLELNDIVWRSVRGANHPMPPPVRAAFVRALPGDDDDEEDRD